MVPTQLATWVSSSSPCRAAGLAIASVCCSAQSRWRKRVDEPDCGVANGPCSRSHRSQAAAEPCLADLALIPDMRVASRVRMHASESCSRRRSSSSTTCIRVGIPTVSDTRTWYHRTMVPWFGGIGMLLCHECGAITGSGVENLTTQITKMRSTLLDWSQGIK